MAAVVTQLASRIRTIREGRHRRQGRAGGSNADREITAVDDQLDPHGITSDVRDSHRRTDLGKKVPLVYFPKMMALPGLQPL